MATASKRKSALSARERLEAAAGKPPTATLIGLVVSLALVAVALFLTVSLATFSPADPPTHLVYPANSPAKNLGGPVGAWTAYHMARLLGFGAWIVVAGLLLHAMLTLWGKKISMPAIRLVGILMLAIGIGGLQSAIFPSSGRLAGLTGGVVGGSAWQELAARFGSVGAGLWLIVLAAVGAIVAFDRWIYMAPAWALGIASPVARRAGDVAVATAGASARVGGGLASGLGSGLGGGLRAGLGALFRPLLGTRGAVKVKLNDLDEEAERFTNRRRKAKVAVAGGDEDVEEAGDEVGESDEVIVERKPRGKKAKVEEEVGLGVDRGSEVIESAGDEDEEVEDEDDLPGAPQVFSQEELREKIAKLPIAFGQQSKVIATDADLRDLQNVGELPGYKFPGLDLLEEPEANFSETLDFYVREQATSLEHALQTYKIQGTIDSIESGPVITLFHVKLAPGTKVAVLEAVSKDLARSLKAVNIRIVPNMAGRDTVGIEVPNTNKEKVRLKELMSNTERYSSMKLPMFLGKDAAGQPLITDLAKAPHMLIAGTTGSGKSVCMNTIIMGFLYTKKPSELKLVLVDPKMVEMSQFKDIPHLMCPVVTEMGKAAAILEWACAKMDERYELLAEAGCRDIASYNDLPWEELKERLNPKTPEEEAGIPRKMPYMVFVIDELADLMMTNKEVEGSIIRIAQKARAVGIHLILATQRPQANVVTGLIKGNMPTRLCFKVASGLDSRIVLDQKGGELLLGQGDMLYLAPSSSKLSRAQGTLVDDSEIRKVVKFMREVASPSFERQLLQIRKDGVEGSDEQKILASQNNSSASLAAAQEDPMFFRAVEIVLETRRGSVSLLQRRLQIGYTRASRLIDLMGISGIISDHKGSVARDVLIGVEDWNAMRALVEADLAKLGANTTGQPVLFSPEGREGATVQSRLNETPPELESPAEAAPWEGQADEFEDAFKDDEGNDRDIRR